MAGISSRIEQMLNELRGVKTWTAIRIDEQQKQIEALEKRIELFEQPAKGSPGKAVEASEPKQKKPRTRRLVPIPERPDVMEAAGVGKDPRPKE